MTGLARAIKEQKNFKTLKDAEKILLTFEKNINASPYDLRLYHFYDTLFNIWDAMHKFEETEARLLKLCDKNPEKNKEDLYKINVHYDLLLAKHWLSHGKNGNYQKLVWAEQTILNLMGKSTNMKEENLCKPCGHTDYDLTYAMILHRLGKIRQAEKLLLAMAGKNVNMNFDDLWKPSKNHNIDLITARVWQDIGKYDLEERLLLAMIDKSPLMLKEELCKPSSKRDVNLTLPVLWEKMNKYHLAEGLLLAMSGKTPNMSIDQLRKPCGQPKIDSTLAKLWEAMGKKSLGIPLSKTVGKKYAGK